MENSRQNELLNAALKSWEVAEPLPARFRENVWSRIAASESPAPVRPARKTFEAWLASILLRPAFARAYLAVILFAAVGAGLWFASEKSSQWDRELAAKYVQSVDPYQTPRQ
jgi:hypothetical protein